MVYRYEAVMGRIHEWIANGVLKPGDRLLSVREMSAKTGYSTVTVHQAYSMLEAVGILTARPRSGFFVSDSARPLPEFDPDVPSAHDHEERELAPAADTQRRLSWLQQSEEGLGSNRVSDDLMPYDELYRYFIANLRWEAARLEDVPWNGHSELREVIARRLGGASHRARADDIIVVRNIEEAVGLCLDLLARPGAKILVETPTDGSTVSAVLGRRTGLVEIYSHPRWGIDPEQFEYLLTQNDVAACLISPNNHPPTGVSYPVDAAKQLVQIASRMKVPIIENMADRDLLFGSPAYELSQFDTQNLVLRVGGFGDTLGSRFGLGWVVLPRKYHVTPPPVSDDNHQLAGYRAIQKAVADFVERRNYERHRRRLQETLSARVQRGLSLVFQNFPESCTVSRPLGGYLCWVRGPKEFSSIKAQSAAAKVGAGFIPGPVFSVARSFDNFLALNLSHPWTRERERSVAQIGELLNAASRSRPS
ncbi:MAG: PLP-dependent aminotransferase family protein [Dehalococcoidia bacterium]